MSPIPDVTKLFTPTGIEVKSPAIEVFTSMRTYGRPGEERVAHQSIRQVLWQLYIAAHDICAGVVSPLSATCMTYVTTYIPFSNLSLLHTMAGFQSAECSDLSMHIHKS